jgi:RimJ/RimL family protein N-acetyltransferase
MSKEKLPIVTKRLILRRFEDLDLEEFVNYHCDPQVARYQSWSEIDTEQAQSFIRGQRAVPFAAPSEWFQIAIADVSNNRLLGDVGVCVRATGTVAEIGFTLARRSQGRGIAFEAVSRVLRLIFEATPVECVEASTDLRNAASMRLLMRLGFNQVKIESARFKGETCEEATYELRQADWRQLNVD